MGLCVGLIAFASVVQATEWYAQPSLGLTGAHHSNYSGSSSTRPKPKHTDSSTLSADLALGAREADWSVQQTLSVDRVQYNPETNTDNTNRSTTLTAALAGERQSASLSLGYDRYNILSTATTATSDAIRIGRNATPSWTWQASERITLALSHGFSESEYLNGRSLGYADSRNHTPGLSLSYQLDARNRVTLSSSHQRYHADIPSPAAIESLPPNFFVRSLGFYLFPYLSETKSISAGMTHQYSETDSLSLSVGRRRTDISQSSYRFTGATATSFQEIQSSSRGTTASASLTHQLETDSLSISASRDIAPTNTGFLTTSQGQSLAYNAVLGPRLSLPFTFSHSHVRSLFPTGSTTVAAGSTDYSIYSYTAALNWRWTESITLTTSLNATRRPDKIAGNDVVTYSGSLGLSYTGNRRSISR